MGSCRTDSQGYEVHASSRPVDRLRDDNRLREPRPGLGDLQPPLSRAYGSSPPAATHQLPLCRGCEPFLGLHIPDNVAPREPEPFATSRTPRKVALRYSPPAPSGQERPRQPRGLPGSKGQPFDRLRRRLPKVRKRVVQDLVHAPGPSPRFILVVIKLSTLSTGGCGQCVRFPLFPVTSPAGHRSVPRSSPCSSPPSTRTTKVGFRCGPP